MQLFETSVLIKYVTTSGSRMFYRPRLFNFDWDSTGTLKTRLMRCKLLKLSHYKHCIHAPNGPFMGAYMLTWLDEAIPYIFSHGEMK